jgi:hypothetical protein
MKAKVERVLTSTKIPIKLYEDFKVVTELSRLGLQDLVERSMYLYMSDSDYRMKIHSTFATYYTGSALVEEVKKHQ